MVYLKRVVLGVCLTLKALGNNIFEIIKPNPNHYLELTRHNSWILSEDSFNGDRAQMGFRDYAYKDKFYFPKNAKIHYVKKLTQIDESKLILDLTSGSSSPDLYKEKQYLLHKRFFDYNSNRVIKRIIDIDTNDKADLVNLLNNPLNKLQTLSILKEELDYINNLIDKVNFTDSQKKAFIHLLKNTLTLIWGPPGTGKTHFLALSVLCLIELYKSTNKPFKVLITAFTHTAIENCLNKIVELQEIYTFSNTPVHKIDIQKIETPKVINIGKEDAFSYLQRNNVCIIGETTYAMLKVLKNTDIQPFDMVIIDEGSQMRVPESLLVLSRLKDNGRLLIAGDDKQLPPIIKGQYPDKDEESKGPLLHKSIFECFSSIDDGRITCQLLENFRMNTTLSTYPALKIYGEKYKPFNTEIANRKIKVKNPNIEIEMLQDILNPDFPLILCILEGLKTGIENIVEAGLVADITEYLRNNLIASSTNKPYDDTEEGDKKFWKDGLFIVSPHHAQIIAIKNELKKRSLREPYFVDTVDKMQGQEAEAVIISYGLSDPEYALLEKEFIYSLNRLNVAITRAKAKCIVFLSKYLLSPPLQVLDNQESLEGISYMLGLEQFVKQHRTEKIYELEENVKLNVYKFSIKYQDGEKKTL